jgi:ABC-type branched-subunit amino acid transport system ATPase component
MVCLRVQELTKSFGGLTAVNHVSLTVEEGTIIGLIGPNGSGKTVTFDCITGFYKPQGGRVFFRDREITGLKPDQIALSGIARSFQITGIFPRLTVLQNLLFSAQEKRVLRNVGASVGFRDRLQKEGFGRIERVLEFTGLQDVCDEVVSSLPHGRQKILEFGTLMLMNPDPVLYLLDEPFAGLTQAEISRYLALMGELRRQGKTFLIVEHNMRVIMGICDRVVVLDHGEKIAEGSPQEIQTHPRVLAAYLGHASASASV